MAILTPALNRLRQAQLRAEAVCTIFEHLDHAVEQFGAAASSVQIEYQKPDDEPVEGDLVPVIILSLRPAAVRSNLERLP